MENTRSAVWGVFGNFVLTAVKIFAGVMGHSMALVADGIHSGADLISSLAVLIGLRISERPPDEEHNYGHAKAEAVAQKVVALFLILAGFEVGNSAIHGFSQAHPAPPSMLALVVAGGSMVIKWIMYWSQRRIALKTGSHSLMASAKDNWMDVISSAVATAAIFGAQLGVPHLDAVGALVVSALVVWLGIGIFSEAANDLMDRAADEFVVQEILEVCHGVTGVLEVSDIRTRMSGVYVLVDLEIEVESRLSLVDAHEISHRVKDAVLTLPRIQDVTVHVNPKMSRQKP